ncbi:hypothetical protein OAF27_01685 [Verrucomicrobiales bacterium]|nr:hypothetical protein [Verrucomicrobiales bacterium]
MKTVATIVALGLVGGCVSPLGAEPTAFEAMSALKSQLGSRIGTKVVQVIGVGGIDQPPVWRFIARDPKDSAVLRDFAVQDGKVVGNQFVPPAFYDQVPKYVVPISRLKIDSGGAFIIADKLANDCGTGFDSIDYEIRGGDPASGAIWILRLRDKKGAQVGEVLIRANDGHVLRQKWGRKSAVGEVVATSIDRAKTSVTNGATAIAGGAVKTGGAVKEFFQGVFDKDKTAPPAARRYDGSY